MRTRRVKEQYRQLFILLAGMAVGLLALLLKPGLGKDIDSYLNISDLIRAAFSTLDYRTYLLFLLRSRLAILLFLFLASLTSLKKYCLDGFILFYALGLVCVGWSLVERYHVQGLWLLTGLVFPQLLFYLPAYSGWIGFFRQMTGAQRAHGGGMGGRKGALGILTILRLFMVTIIGILSECYVNPKILKIFLKNI